MPFGPFLSQEEKNKINADMKSNYGSKAPAASSGQGVGVGPFVSPEQKKRINATYQQYYGQEAPEQETQAEKTQRINSAVGSWWKSVTTPSVGGAGAMMSGNDPTKTAPAPAVDTKPTAESYYDQARRADPTGVPGQLPPSAGTGGDVTTTNANGVTQTLKNTGFKPAGFEKANELLGNLGVGGVGYGDFQSNNFYSNVDRDDMPQLGTDIEAFSPSVAGSYLNDNPNIDISKAYQEGSPELTGGAGFSVTDSVLPEGYLSSQLSPKGIKGDMGTNERYRSEMLHNGNTAQGGLRAAEASKGLLYASGQYWQANPNAGQEGQKDFLSISKAEAKAIKSSDMNAQDFFKSKMGKIKGEGPVADPVEYGKMLNN